MLAKVTDQIEDGELKKIAIRAVREVRKQENDHVAWNQQTLTKLALEAAHQDGEMEKTITRVPKKKRRTTISP